MACADPVDTVQAAAPHTHTLTITAADINGDVMTFTTGPANGVAGQHTHGFPLTEENLGQLRAGATLTMLMTNSTSAGAAHTHSYTVSCA